MSVYTNIPQGYKQTKVGVIPEDWKDSDMKSICKINQGLQISISERLTKYEPNSYFYITNEFLKVGAKNNYYIKNPPKNVICKKDDLLMTRTGNTGKVVSGVSGAFHNNFFKIDYNRKKLNKFFLYSFLTFSSTQHKILVLAGNSTIPDLNHSDFYKLRISIPPFPEQERIASCLITWDKGIEKLSALIEAKKHQKKGLMQGLFNGQLTIKNGQLIQAKEGEDFTEDWEEVSLGEVLKIGSGKDYKHLDSGAIPVFGSGGLMLNVNDYLYDGDSVGIGRKGTIDKPIFLTGKFWTVDTLFYTHSFKNTIPKFIYYNFLKINWYKYNEASGVPSLSKKTIEKIKIKLPILKNQIAITEVLTTADQEISLLEKKLEAIQLQKKGLMQVLLTGKKRLMITPE